METTLKFLSLSLIIGFSVPSLADDSPSAPPVKTHTQKMHACMDRKRADNNGMSTPDLKKACQQELQSADNHPSVPPQPVPVP